jgi:hypothetical protein
MTQYTNRLTLAVPESLMDAANNLSLIMGRSADDINTFTTATWEDITGNLYAVASAVSKPIVVQALSTGLPDPLPAHAEDADIALAQQALDAIEVFQSAQGMGESVTEATQAAPSAIILAIDNDPLTALTEMGLTRVEVEL